MSKKQATRAQTTRPSMHAPVNPIEALTADQRRVDALVFVRAARVVLEGYVQHVQEAAARELARIAAVEAWANGGPVPEIAARYAALAKAAYEGRCRVPAGENDQGCVCPHCSASAELAELTGGGFGHLDAAAYIAFDWITGSGRRLELSDALDELHDHLSMESNNFELTNRLMELAEAAARRQAASIGRAGAGGGARAINAA